MAEVTTNIYPHIVIHNNKTPNRFLAFPLLGFLIKLFILFPVFIEMLFLGFAAIFIIIINWFVISFTKKYWDTAYTFFLGMFRLTTKIKLFILGLTDKYPGFSFSDNGLFELTIAKPEKPNMWLNIPLLGIFVRLILLIPYLIFNEVMERGSGLAMVMSWFAVLFKGKFPESLYEFEKDTIRVTLASSCYTLGLSDRYPSFAISMQHQTIKILLIIAGSILAVINMKDTIEKKHRQEKVMYQYDRMEQQKVDYSPPVRHDKSSY